MLVTVGAAEGMVFKYDVRFDEKAIIKNIDRITNQIFKLLPSREENGDWETALQNIVLEIVGMKILWIDQPRLFSLLCRLEALGTLTDENEFLVFRKLIFECLSILNEIKKELRGEQNGQFRQNETARGMGWLRYT